MKPVAKWVLLSLLGWLLLGSLLLLFLALPPGEQFLKNQLEHLIVQRLRYPVAIEKMETNLFSRVQVWNLTARTPSASSQPPALVLPYGQIEGALWKILFGELRITKVYFSGLSVELVSDSLNNHPAALLAGFLLAGASLPGAKRISLDSLIIENGLVRYRDRQLPLNLKFADFSAHIHQSASTSYFYRMGGQAHLELQGIALLSSAQVAFAGTIGNRRIVADSLTVKLAQSSITGNLALDATRSPAGIQGLLSIEGSAADFQPLLRQVIPPELTPLLGKMITRARISGTLRNPQISLETRFGWLRLGNLQLKEGRILGKWMPPNIVLDSLQLEAQQGRFTGSGFIRPGDTLETRLTLRASSVDIASFWHWFYQEPSPYRGLMNGQIHLRGNLAQPSRISSQANLHLSKLRFEDRTLPDFDAWLIFRNNRGQFRLVQGTAEIRANVTFSGKRIRGEASFHLPDVEPIMGFFHLGRFSGSVSGKGILSGSIRRPEFHGQVFGRNLLYQGFPLDTLTATLLLSREGLSIRNSRFSGEMSRPPLRLSQLKGVYRYRGTLMGEWPNLYGDVQVSSAQPGYGRWKFERGSFSIEFRGREILLREVCLTRDQIRIQGDGKLETERKTAAVRLSLSSQSQLASQATGTPDESSNSAVMLNAIPAGELQMQLSWNDSAGTVVQLQGESLQLPVLLAVADLPIPLRGELNFRTQIAGNPRQPDLQAQVRIVQPRWKTARWDSAKISFGIRQQVLSIPSLKLYSAGHLQWMKGEIGLARNEQGHWIFSPHSPIKLQLGTSAFPLSALFPSPELGPAVSGRLTCNLQAGGTLIRPTLRGSLDLADGWAQFHPAAPPIKNLAMSLRFQDSLIAIQRFRAEVEEIPLELSGKLIMRKNSQWRTELVLSAGERKRLALMVNPREDELNLLVQAEAFPLTLLRPFLFPLRQLDGYLNGQLQLSGKINLPAISGNLEGFGIQMQAGDAPVQITSGRLMARFQPGQIQIDSLYAGLNGGHISSAGTLAYDSLGFTAAQLQIRVQNILLARPGVYFVNLRQGNLNLLKRNGGLLLEGDLFFGKTTLSRDVGPAALPTFFRSIEKSPVFQSKFFRHIQLQIRLQDGDNLWIDTQLARLRLNSRLTVMGTMSGPYISGHLKVEEGYVLYLGRKFKVEKAELSFADSARISPVVDFRAVTRIKKYQTLTATPYLITLTIRGPLDRTETTFTSEPYLEMPDILALLTVGATREQATGNKVSAQQAAIEKILPDQLVGLSGGGISGYFSRKVGDLLGLDEVSIEGNLLRRNRKAGPQLLASKKISDRASLTYFTTVGSLNDQGIRLEYRLSRYFSIEGQTDQRSRSAIDLKYHIKFK